MQTVSDIINEIIRKEGGFTNDPTDRGHKLRKANGDKWDSYCTNMGVTQATLSGWLGRQATVEEVRELTRDTVYEIYETQYFTTPRLHTIPALIQPFMTDSAVHHGPRQAIKFMQDVVNLTSFGPISSDGVIGPQSRAAVETAVINMGGYFLNALVERRIQFFDALIARDPSQKRFEKGWKSRANSFRVEVQ